MIRHVFLHLLCAVLSDGAENKPPQMDSVSSPLKTSSLCKDCEDYKSEMKLQKVEIRLAERKVRETEARLKLVREVMLKEEKEAREAAEAKLKEAEETVEKAKAKAQKEVEKDLSELKDKLSDAEVKVDEMASLKRRLQDSEAEAARAKNKLDEVMSGELEELRKKESGHQMLKVTCLELQDQLAEYEKVREKNSPLI